MQIKKCIGVNNGPYCKPIELLQDYKDGARQSWLEGMIAGKSSSSLFERERKQPTEQAYFIKALSYNWLMHLCVCRTHDEKDVLLVWNADKSLPLRNKPTVPSHIQAPSIGRVGVISLFKHTYFLYKTWLACCSHFQKCLTVGEGVWLYEGITDMQVSGWVESASEWSCRINISCTAGPNMYSLSNFTCVHNRDMSIPPSIFC